MTAEAKALSRDILQTIEIDTGFFLAKGFDQHSQTVYGFLHLTFAEYLTARFMAEQWSSGQLNLLEYIHDDRWHEVLLLMAGHIGTWATAQVTRLVHDILNVDSPYEKYLHRNLLLTAEILGDNVRVKRELQDEIVSQLLCLALNTPHIDLWNSIVYRVSDIARVLQLGRPALQLQFEEHDNLEMQVRKAVLLVMTEENMKDDTLRALLQGLTETEKIRSLAEPFLYSNTFSQEEDATHLLAIQTANSGRYFRISEETASRIAKLKLSVYGVNSLVENQSRTSKDTYLWLLNPGEILALGLPEIISLLKATNNWPTRFVVAATLELQNHDISIYQNLIELAVSKDSIDIRIDAIDSIQALLSITTLYHPEGYGDDNIPNWINSIQALITSNDDPIIRSKALKVLSAMSGDAEGWFEILYYTLEDSDEVVRLTAATVASRYGSKIPDSVIAKLQLLLEDASLDIRRASAHALIRAGKFVERDIPVLLEAGFRQTTESVKETDMDAWLTDLLSLSNKSSSQETLNAITARIREFLEASINQTDEQNEFYWYPFFEERKILHRKELAKAISALFNNPNPEIRYRAVRIWSQMRSETFTSDQWTQLLKDDAPNVKVAAIQALNSVDLQQPKIIDILLCHLVDPDLRIANSAASTLLRIRESELRQNVIDYVATLVVQEPDNKNPYQVLWGLVSPTARWKDEIPF